MITDIPTKTDFYTMADHMVNEAWEKIADLAYDYRDINLWNSYCKTSEFYTESDIKNLEHYWVFARPKLITSFNLILQSIEFRLKGLIVEISPYLLITNATRNTPKPDSEGNISFSEFHTLDAQDLIKVYNTLFSITTKGEDTIIMGQCLTVMRDALVELQKATEKDTAN